MGSLATTYVQSLGWPLLGIIYVPVPPWTDVDAFRYFFVIFPNLPFLIFHLWFSVPKLSTILALDVEGWVYRLNELGAVERDPEDRRLRALVYLVEHVE